MAKDRSWFGDDYTPFKSYCLIEGHPITVIGIGTVDLPVKLGPSSHGTLRLENVLHVPDMLCNIIGDILTHGYGISNNRFIELSTEQTVAYLTLHYGLYVVLLSEFPHGPKVGPSPFGGTMNNLIGISWPEPERMRFEAVKRLLVAL